MGQSEFRYNTQQITAVQLGRRRRWEIRILGKKSFATESYPGPKYETLLNNPFMDQCSEWQKFCRLKSSSEAGQKYRPFLQIRHLWQIGHLQWSVFVWNSLMGNFRLQTCTHHIQTPIYRQYILMISVLVWKVCKQDQDKSVAFYRMKIGLLRTKWQPFTCRNRA